MRVGIDLYAVDPNYSGGVNTFTFGLVEGVIANINHDDILVLIVSKRNKDILTEKFRHHKQILIYCVTVSQVARYLNRVLIYLSWILREYRLRHWYDRFFRRRLNHKIDSLVDGLIVPTSTLNFYALKVPTILCIHDIQQEFHPENFTFHELILRWAPYRLSSSRATTIQVSSQYIKDCLLEKFSFLSPQRLLLAPEGVDLTRFSSLTPDQIPPTLPESVRKCFVFYPAQIWPHKNHSLLMDALASFRNRMGFEMPCVLTGTDYGYWHEIEQLRNMHGLKLVYYLGRVDFPVLLWLYKNCAAVLALGLHESSSLPVREGAAFGKPLICADIEPNVEASRFLKINLFSQNSPDQLMSLLISLFDPISDISIISKQNINLVKKLRWDFITKLYITKIIEFLNK